MKLAYRPAETRKFQGGAQRTSRQRRPPKARWYLVARPFSPSAGVDSLCFLGGPIGPDQTGAAYNAALERPAHWCGRCVIRLRLMRLLALACASVASAACFVLHVASPGTELRGKTWSPASARG